MNELRKKNRILLVMSIFPKIAHTLSDIRLNEFSYEEKNGGKTVTICNCASQLEPIVKMMWNQYRDSHEALEVVVLCSKEAAEERIEGYSALSYFMNRIDEYTRSLIRQDSLITERIDEYCVRFEKNGKEDYENSFQRYENPLNPNLSFTVFGCDDSDSDECIHNVAKYLVESKEEINQFWIDTHGGLREIYLVLAAVISLLDVYGVEYQEIFGIETGKNAIHNQMDSFNTFLLVSGIKEFTDYGSVDTLHAFFKDIDELQSCLKAMDIVSDGLKMCDPNLYTEGLKSLGKEIKTEFRNPLFNIFKEHLVNDYGELLDIDKVSPLKIIKRCLDKKLYQQALTFIESMMPEEFVKKKIVYYDQTKRYGNNFSAEDLFYSERNGNKKGKESNKKDTKTYLSIPQFFFDEMIFQLWLKNKNNNKEDMDFKAIDCVVRCEKREDYNKKLPNLIKVAGEEIHILSDSQSNNANDLPHLLVLHKSLKRCRNMVNHSGQGKRPRQDDLIKAMYVYVELAKKVFGER